MTTPEDTLHVGIPNPGPSFRDVIANRNFSLLFVGQLGSEVGNGLVQLALPWLVLELTGSAFQLGFAYFFQFLPILLFGLIGGVFVDRWDRRLTLVTVDLIRGLAFLSVGAIYLFDRDFLTVEHIYAVIFLEGSLANFFNPARTALMPNLVSKENLRPANSLMEVSRHIGFLIAPPVGGLLVALTSPQALMFADGVTFFISAVTLYFISWRQPLRDLEQSNGWIHSLERVGQQAGDGLRTIAGSRLLQVTVFLGFSLNLVIAPIQLLLPLFVRDVKGEEADYFALLVAGLVTGLIGGSLAAPAIARRIGLGRLVIRAVLILGAVICAASWPPTLWPPVIAMAAAGAALGSLAVAQTTMIQGATTDEERGRVSATYYTFTLGVRPFSFLAVGTLASSGVDVRFLFVALGLLALALGTALFRMPEVREAH